MQDLLHPERLQDLRRFAELGRMSAVLLHEISNPLTAALLNLEATEHESNAVRQAKHDIKLMKRYIEAARAHIHRQSKVTVFCVQPQLDQLKRVITPLARRAGVQVDITPLPGCRLRGDSVKFLQIISNLVVNALDAHQETTCGGQHIKVTLSQDDTYLLIEVTDNASGITAEALPQLFDEFYTTKHGAKKGLGIGLAIVKQYVTTDFGGTISVSSDPAGTQFSVKLPALPKKNA